MFHQWVQLEAEAAQHQGLAVFVVDLEIKTAQLLGHERTFRRVNSLSIEKTRTSFSKDHICTFDKRLPVKFTKTSRRTTNLRSRAIETIYSLFHSRMIVVIAVGKY